MQKFIYLRSQIVLKFIMILIFAVNETCEDGIQNQNELGIDCGGDCVACGRFLHYCFNNRSMEKKLNKFSKVK